MFRYKNDDWDENEKNIHNNNGKTMQTHTKVLNLIANADVVPTSYYRNIQSMRAMCMSGGKDTYNSTQKKL